MGLFRKKREELVVGWDAASALADVKPRKRGGLRLGVVGGFAHPEAWERVRGGWTEHRSAVNDAVLVKVAFEPKNPHDPNAIVVTAGGEAIGYIAKEAQGKVAPLLLEHGGPLQLVGELDCYRNSDPSKPWFDRLEMWVHFS